MDFLIIGWDAATKDHVTQFDMPFWESLPHRGDLLPEYPFDKAGYISSANAWTTITTGASFAEHGMLGFVYAPYSGHPLDFIVKRAATQKWLPPLIRRILIGRVLGTIGAGSKGKKGDRVDSTDIKYKRIWEYLDGDSLVYGLPLTYPTWETNGVVVSGIPAPRTNEATNPVVYPADLEDVVYDGSGAGYYVDMNSPVNDQSILEESYCAEHQERMRSNVEKYVELYRKISQNKDLEFGFLMLRGLDDIMHATKDTSIIRDSYQMLDELTSNVVNKIDPDSVLVLSDHGMRPASDYRIDKNMKMDHDTEQGIWGATEDIEIERHTDVTPHVLGQLGVDAGVPSHRNRVDTDVSDSDRDAIHRRLEDLGYA